MFTGIIEDMGRVGFVGKRARGRILEIETRLWNGLEMGESVAVNGVCLTVTATGGGAFKADVSPESLRVTTLGDLKAGEAVNIERAMVFGDRLGGHLVSGHIDATGRVSRVDRSGNALVITLDVPPEVSKYLIERGSIAVDGVSLTSFNVSEETFDVAIIPHTAGMTTLGGKRPGNPMNLEADLIGKYVEKLAGTGRRVGAIPESGLTLDLLRKYDYA